jgi:hypothetical protein
MPVQTMNRRRIGLADYAAGLGLSSHALRKWRDRFEDSKAEMDGRSLLHPSAQAQLSSAANCAAALATLPGLVRAPDGMMAIELEMGSEAHAKPGRLAPGGRELNGRSVSEVGRVILASRRAWRNPWASDNRKLRAAAFAAPRPSGTPVTSARPDERVTVIDCYEVGENRHREGRIVELDRVLNGVFFRGPLPRGSYLDVAGHHA